MQGNAGLCGIFLTIKAEDLSNVQNVPKKQITRTL